MQETYGDTLYEKQFILLSDLFTVSEKRSNYNVMEVFILLIYFIFHGIIFEQEKYEILFIILISCDSVK